MGRGRCLQCRYEEKPLIIENLAPGFGSHWLTTPAGRVKYNFMFGETEELESVLCKRSDEAFKAKARKRRRDQAASVDPPSNRNNCGRVLPPQNWTTRKKLKTSRKIKSIPLGNSTI